jgi:hypothetical protein
MDVLQDVLDGVRRALKEGRFEEAREALVGCETRTAVDAHAHRTLAEAAERL